MDVRMSPAMRSAQLQGTLDFMNNGGPCRCEIYQGTIPSTPGGSIGSSVLLVNVIQANPWGVMTVSGLEIAISPLAFNVASGNAGWARWYNGDDVWAMDTDVTLDTGNGFCRLTDLTLFAGGKTQTLGGLVV